MTLLSQNISNVRAFALPAAIKPDGRCVRLIGAAVVEWQSDYVNMLHQVYVNGKFAGVTVDVNQRVLVAAVGQNQQTAVRIEVFAVESGFANVDFSNSLATSAQAGRAKIEFANTYNLPFSGSVNYYRGDEKLNKREIKIQSGFTDKGGFGLSSFAKSDFGYDGSASVGFGKGNFGKGNFGFDSVMFCWKSTQLKSGNYKFAVEIKDRFGGCAEQIETQNITVIPPARPAEKLTADSFDSQSGRLLLKIK